MKHHLIHIFVTRSLKWKKTRKFVLLQTHGSVGTVVAQMHGLELRRRMDFFKLLFLHFLQLQFTFDDYGMGKYSDWFIYYNEAIKKIEL